MDDITLRIAVQAKVFLIGHPDLDRAIDKGVALLSWAPAVITLVGGAVEYAHESHVHMPEPLESAKHFVETVENSQVPRAAEEAFSLNDLAEHAEKLDQSLQKDTSYAIGGPEVEAQIELREAWQAERDVLLEKQSGEVVKAETMAAKARGTVEDRTAGSPEQQQRLDDFDKTFGDYQKDMADRHGAEVRDLDDKWQAKFGEFERDHGRVEVYPEHIKPLDPDLDRNR